MSDLLEQTMPGWRRDPSGRYEWRWWDGNGWTNRVANSAPAEPEPAPAPAAPPAASATDPVATGGAPTAAADAASTPAPPTLPPSNVSPSTLSPSLLPPSTGHAVASPTVRTYPSAHDGASGSKWDGPYVPEAVLTTAAPARRRGPVGRATASVAAFFRSFWEQEESYHSPSAGVDVPPHPKRDALAPLPNYGRAGLVTLAAIGVAVGAYLPWITYRIDDITQHRTGHELGAAAGFVLAAAAFSIAALLGARHRVMGWATMGMSVVVAAMVAIRLLDVHDQVTQLGSGPTVSADVGIGMWVMLGAAAIGLVAAFRLDTPADVT